MSDAPQKPETPDRDVYWKMYPANWRGDANLRFCSLAARGLWVELLNYAHQFGGYVRLNGQPPSIKELGVIVGAKPAEVGRLLAELTKYGICSLAEDGAIMSRRMVRDAHRRDASKANGKLGGRPKQEPRSKPKPNLDPNLDETHITLDLDLSSPDALGSGSSESRSNPTAEPDRFAAFWAAYPRHTKKPDALRAFGKLDVDDALLAQMLDAIAWQAQTPQWTKQRGEFIPYPSSWLNQRRWEDEPFHAVDDADAAFERVMAGKGELR